MTRKILSENAVNLDTALILKMKCDNREIKNFTEAKQYLDSSVIFKKLLSDFDRNVLNLHWRLTQLSEIPFAGNFSKVQKWLDELISFTYTNDGFSLTGKSDFILSCYNAMITTLLIRLNSAHKDKIQKGIEWILKYQNFERNLNCEWKGSGIKKYGGCMKSVPCYIGLVKSVISLSEFKKIDSHKKTKDLEEKLKQGLEYILDHNLYKRKSNGMPITNYIDKINFPFHYKTNIIELLRLIKDNKMIDDPRCRPAIALLNKKKKPDGYWHNNNVYTSNIWLLFDNKKEPAYWTSYIIESILNNKKIYLIKLLYKINYYFPRLTAAS